MNSRDKSLSSASTSSSRSRRVRSDLIDLSKELKDNSGDNILDIFDPLSHNNNEHEKPDNSLDRTSLLSNRAGTRNSTELRRKDRRFRSNGAVPGKKTTSPNNLNSRNNLVLTCEAEVSRSSSNIPTEQSECNKTTNISNELEHTTLKQFNKLSINSSSSTNSSHQDSNSSKLGGSSSNVIELDLNPHIDSYNENRLKLVRKHQRSSQELELLTKKIKSFRGQFKHHDTVTNSGLVYSQTLYSSKEREMSVKMTITSPMAKDPLNFTCNISTTIEHLISHAVCSLVENFKEDDSMDNYMLKVTGKDEFFDSKFCLADYALVSYCLKFDLDVQLTLVNTGSVKRPFLRTSQDDFRCKSLLLPDDILSRTAILKYSDLNYESLNIIIDTFEVEAKRLYHDVTNRSTSLQTQSLLQATKAICSLMMSCETRQLTESKDNLAQLCSSYKSEGTRLKDEDSYKMIEVIKHAIKRLLQSMHRLLELTSCNLPVDYEVGGELHHHGSQQQKKLSFVDTPISLLKDQQLALEIQLISQLKPEWLTAKYQDFFLEVKLLHGEVLLTTPVTTSKIRIDISFFPRLTFDEEITLPISYSSLPRESRLVMTLYGIETPPVATSTTNQFLTVNDGRLHRSGSSVSLSSTAPMYSSSPRGSNLDLYNKNTEIYEPNVQTALAVSMAYIFDHELSLHKGDRLLNMYTLQVDQKTNEMLDEEIFIESFADRNNPVLVVDFKRFPPEKRIYFPDIETITKEAEKSLVQKLDFNDMDPGAKHLINQIIFESQIYERLMDDEKNLLWDNRMFLTKIPSALPKVLLSVPNWSANQLAEIYSLFNSWEHLSAVDAIQLLLPSFPDYYVRKLAVSWLSKQHDDELCDYLPQLIQAFRYEKSLDCPLFWLLMERALKNVRIANFIYWQLKLNSNDNLFQERSETMINCLLYICGSAFWKSIDNQEELLSKLSAVSNDIKKVRDSQRMSVLQKKLEQVQDYLIDKKPTMPWAPSLEVCDLELRSCSYFPSNTLPLKLAFRSCEESCNKTIKFHTYDTIFKMGDDLRQDMLAIQMIRIMEKLWLREGLDLRMVTFDCLATNDRQGMVEMVQNAETLRKIQQSSSFIAGAFNPRAIDNYIRLWNTSELEYKTALDKFLHSCAGYSVATYILGICDRHNDNIMITNSGHLFHIDFGKFLGDAQMMGAIKRDRTPFVLTSDMAYVINGGDKPSKKFQTFIELCAMGFNIIRRYRNLFLNLFSLMSRAKINGLNSDSVKYIDKMLMPNLSEPEAMAEFTRLINECLNSRSTQVNFFIHSLAQLRFSYDNSKQSLLSFVPKTFSIETDGKIEAMDIVTFFKKYEAEKQYYYVVRIKREGQPDVTDIIRTFREFSELQMKLISQYPCSSFHDINKSSGSFLMDFVGRNNTREIAERRLVELRTFLKKLLALPSDISNCDLIYTFFHPILRDQALNSIDSSFNESTSSTFGSQEYSESQRRALYLGSNGQVKLSISFKNSSLIIMIMHAKNLACIDGSLEPNCYAKTYLLPDPHKQTKRKTRVVRQSRHPSFMELIVYKDIPLEVLKKSTLQVSVWHSELVQYKAFLGAALIRLDKIDLSVETTSWYPLKNF